MPDSKDFKISVIIPTLNEEDRIGDLIKSLRALNNSLEIIISDGQSRDNTVNIAKSLNTVVVVNNSLVGRGAQMDSGAKVATGDVLIFLHSDTTLPHNWENLVSTALQQDNAVGGAFTLKTDGHGFKYRVLEKVVKLRNSLLKLTYGDQAIFIKQNVFNKIGGFRSLHLMEDIDCVKRLRAVGEFILLPEQAVTSARRWEKKGFFKTTTRNIIYICLYFIGIKPETIYRLYYK